MRGSSSVSVPAMRVVVQRVSEASVKVDGQTVAAMRHGLLILLGVEHGDSLADLEWLVPKVAKLRIFSDAEGKMNLSAADTGAEAIVVSQFTLHASTRKGNRPSFIRAARPVEGESLCEAFAAALEAELGVPVGRGRFGADMKVALVNDGPVTIVIDSRLRE